MKVRGEARGLGRAQGPRAVGLLTPTPHSYLVAHSLGRRMLYPGSVYLLQKALMPVLLQGQARLVEEVRLPTPAPDSPSPPDGRGLSLTWPCVSPSQCDGRRAKLLACDGNEIDTMFVDRRGTAEPQGQKLVRGAGSPEVGWGGQWGSWDLSRAAALGKHSCE